MVSMIFDTIDFEERYGEEAKNILFKMVKELIESKNLEKSSNKIRVNVSVTPISPYL